MPPNTPATVIKIQCRCLGVREQPGNQIHTRWRAGIGAFWFDAHLTAVWINLPSETIHAAGSDGFAPVKFPLQTRGVSVGLRWDGDHQRPTIAGNLMAPGFRGHMTEGVLFVEHPPRIPEGVRRADS